MGLRHRTVDARPGPQPKLLSQRQQRDRGAAGERSFLSSPRSHPSRSSCWDRSDRAPLHRSVSLARPVSLRTPASPGDATRVEHGSLYVASPRYMVPWYRATVPYATVGLGGVVGVLLRCQGASDGPGGPDGPGELECASSARAPWQRHRTAAHDPVRDARHGDSRIHSPWIAQCAPRLSRPRLERSCALPIRAASAALASDAYDFLRNMTVRRPSEWARAAAAVPGGPGDLRRRRLAEDSEDLQDLSPGPRA